MLLDDQTVKELLARHVTGRVDIADTKSPVQLILRINAGVAEWSTRYVFAGTRRRLILGQWPKVNRDKAILAAGETRASVRLGIDPQASRRLARKGVTLKEAAEQYLEAAMPREGKDRRTLDESTEFELGTLTTWREYRRTLKRTVLPGLNPRTPLAGIERAEVKRFLATLARQVKGQAIWGHKVLRNIFRYAVEFGLRADNPIADLRRPCAYGQRTRYLGRDEIARLWAHLDGRGTTAARALQIMLLTGQRRGEVLSMSWADIDPPWWGFKLTKNRHPQRVYLSAAALQIIRRLEPAECCPSNGRTPVFRTVSRRRKEKGKGLQNDWIEVETRLFPGLGIEGVTAHVLRHTMATYLMERGFSRDVRDAVLNHIRGGTTAGYEHGELNHQRQAAWTWWGEFVLACARGEAGGNVLHFPTFSRELA